MDGRQEVCIPCRKAYDAEFYRKNREKRYSHNKDAQDRARQVIYTALKEGECVDCGESDPVVLEFDHVRGEKIENLSVMLQKRRPKQMVLDEIAKCDIRCANCHRRVTYARSGSYRLGVERPEV